MSKVQRIKVLLETVLIEAAGDKAAPWWKPYTQYQLTKYPVNIPQDQVTIDTAGNVNSHWVMSWTDPKSGRRVYAYTKEFAAKQAQSKWTRTSKMSPEKIQSFKDITAKTLMSKGDDKLKQAAAVISIIAQTGLRPGSQAGFAQTGNRGVLTLGPDNIHITGDKIGLSFVGKSYQQNDAEIIDSTLASYLQQRLASSKGQQFVFDVPRHVVDDYYKRILKMGAYKIKDLRTHTAGQLAKEILHKDPLPPPPVPDDPKDIKKAVKIKLKHVFDTVSKQLNNTPAMAKGSYVNPSIINDWLEELGLHAELNNSVYKEEIDEEQEPIEVIGNAPIWNLPKWWDSEDIVLVKNNDSLNEVTNESLNYWKNEVNFLDNTDGNVRSYQLRLKGFHSEMKKLFISQFAPTDMKYVIPAANQLFSPNADAFAKEKFEIATNKKLAHQECFEYAQKKSIPFNYLKTSRLKEI